LKSPKTIRGLMILVAILGLSLGIGINAAPFAPLILAAAIVMTPQAIIVAICAGTSSMMNTTSKMRSRPHS
jgi:hypothetical protein